jgi:hypothetical protein
MQATRALIQIFLPRLALRRRRASTRHSTAVPRAEPARSQTRLSRACDCPELRGSPHGEARLAFALGAPFDSHALFARRASSSSHLATGESFAHPSSSASVHLVAISVATIEDQA